MKIQISPRNHQLEIENPCQHNVNHREKSIIVFMVQIYPCNHQMKQKIGKN